MTTLGHRILFRAVVGMKGLNVVSRADNWEMEKVNVARIMARLLDGMLVFFAT